MRDILELTQFEVIRQDVISEVMGNVALNIVEYVIGVKLFDLEAWLSLL